MALTECAIAAGVTGVELVPSEGFAATIRSRPGDGSLHDDLGAIDCPAGALAGLPPGPDRPWLITSRNCAFLAMYDRKTRETVLLRADADALARGTVSWQASDDAVDVDFFTAAGEGLPRRTGHATFSFNGFISGATVT